MPLVSHLSYSKIEQNKNVIVYVGKSARTVFQREIVISEDPSL